MVADTHVPDRLARLPSGLAAALAGVDAILHAGDVTTGPVLDQLNTIAPVHAVRGNRDFFLRLPLDRVLEFGEDAQHLEHRLAGGGGSIQTLLMQK